MKLSILSAIGVWAAKSSESVQPEVVLLIDKGLKEKEPLRRGHLRCLRVMSKNFDTLLKVSKFYFFDCIFVGGSII